MALKSLMRCMSLVVLPVVASVVLSGCATPRVNFDSAVVQKPSQDIRKIDFVLAEDDLKKKGLTVAKEADPKTIDFNYANFGRLFKERAPLVLAANGIAGEVKVLPPVKWNEELDYKAVSPGVPAVFLKIASVTVQQVTLFHHRNYMKMNAQLMEPASAGEAKRAVVWASQVNFRLGIDEIHGILKIHRIDAELVDELVAGLLEGMASQGVITLPQGKAVRPPKPAV